MVKNIRRCKISCLLLLIVFLMTGCSKDYEDIVEQKVADVVASAENETIGSFKSVTKLDNSTQIYEFEQDQQNNAHMLDQVGDQKIEMYPYVGSYYSCKENEDCVILNTSTLKQHYGEEFTINELEASFTKASEYYIEQLKYIQTIVNGNFTSSEYEENGVITLNYPTESGDNEVIIYDQNQNKLSYSYSGEPKQSFEFQLTDTQKIKPRGQQ